MKTHRLLIILGVMLLSLGLATFTLKVANAKQESITIDKNRILQFNDPISSELLNSNLIQAEAVVSEEDVTGSPGSGIPNGSQDHPGYSAVAYSPLIGFDSKVLDANSKKYTYGGTSDKGFPYGRPGIITGIPSDVPYDEQSSGIPTGVVWHSPQSLDSLGDWDSLRVGFPRVISDTGQYLLWYDGRGPQGWGMGMATSTDGNSWMKYAGNPVLKPGAGGEWDETYRGQAAIMNEGGVYKMWYSGGGSAGPWQTGYATSTNGIDWNIYGGNPVLPVGGSGDWDEMESDAPAVINDGGTYKMWYHGCDASYSTCSIGYAESPDGINWTKYTANPVLTGTVGAWDEGQVLWPAVIKNGGTYKMWYVSGGAIGLATSTDGILWTKEAGNPVLTDGWDGGGAGAQMVMLEGSTYKMWFRSGQGATRGIGYATSTDGISWDMYAGNPVLLPGAPGLKITVNYAHEWVVAQTAPDIPITITVAGKNWITGMTDVNGEFRSWEWAWHDPQPLDIAPGDIVAAVAAGLTTDVNPVGTINGDLDVNADTIAGTIQAPFGTLTLTVRCEVWVKDSPPPPIEVTGVSADGGSYFCDFGAEGWNLQPGQDVAVMYLEPDGDTVINVFQAPAPQLGVWKWNGGGDGSTRPGGVYVYGFYYENNGNLTAADTVIVDNLPEHTSWAGDTSGLPHVAAGQVITWQVGDLEPGVSNIFWLTVQVEDGVITGSQVITQNCASISTATVGDYDPNNDNTCSKPLDVWPGEIEMQVDKWVNPGDPTPGQEFTYNIQVCNNRGAPAGPVVLTETFPVSTTLVNWQLQQTWQNYWIEVSRDEGHLVLSAPGFPGYTCSDLRIRLLLDGAVPLNTNLMNTVDIFVNGDVYPDNNQRINTDAYVSPPRYDMSINKWYNNAVLVSGGYINYGINYWNAGNIATQAWITDTLPQSTTYQIGSGRRGDGAPFEPVIITDEYLVWYLGEVPVFDGFNFNFTLNIASEVLPGAELNNCASIGTMHVDQTPWDGTACVKEVVHDHGPNLRVRKYRNWNGDGQLGYNIRFDNLGDEAVNDVWITDTLPLSTTWDGTDNINFDKNRVIYEDLTAHVLRWKFSTLYPGDSGSIDINANLDEPGARVRWYTNTVQIDTPPFDTDPGDNLYTDVAFSRGEVERVEFWSIGDDHVSMWGAAVPNSIVTIVVPEGTITVTSDGKGDWSLNDVGHVYPGDVVIATAGAGLLPVVITVPDPYSVQVDTVTNRVWGTIGGALNERMEVHGYWTDGYREELTDGSGNYLAVYPDIPRGGEGYIRYVRQVNYADAIFHRYFRSMDLVMRTNYAHDWVEGNYESGHTLWLTVTESDGFTVKGTAELETGNVPWWGGQTGFSTNWQGWQGGQPDIQEGDWVYGALDNGQTTSVRIGTINGGLDTAADIVSGTINVPWFTGLLRLRCEVWVDYGPPGIELMVDANHGSYLCDFSNVGWDLKPGQDVAVTYVGLDSNDVINVFQEPAPRLRINKWADGNPGEGGNFTFHIEYWNDGAAPAEDVVITDTLLSGMSYITDTAGFPRNHGVGIPEFVAWDLGSVEPNSYNRFDLVVHVTAAASETITNVVQIATSNPFDQSSPWERESWWIGPVVPNDTYLVVDKYAWTGDPTPGYDFVWVVNACNKGTTGSSQVTLTDTLPMFTTLNHWWGQYPGWQQVHQDDVELVLTHPSVSGWQCSEVYLNLHLDPGASIGSVISNTAKIFAENDLNGGWETTNWVKVGDPHTNLNINKQWNWGQLVPGGEIRYNINYVNNGNLPVNGPILITDTLPVHTTFQESLGFGGGPRIDPILITPDYVVWQIDGLANGYSGGFEVVLKVHSDAMPGTILTNTAVIQPQPSEDTYDDNTSTWVEKLNNHGPNLRVRKYGDWHGFGEGHNAWYNVIVENIGDAYLEHVVVTDTYPLSMSLDGQPGLDWGNVENYTSNDAEHWFSVTYKQMKPGYGNSINFNTVIPGSDPVPWGLVFTNTANIMLVEGDTNPDDNSSSTVLGTGPDLYVDKTFVSGTVLPGELITFSLLFGNAQPGHTWWWSTQGNVWITDTLPVGMEFITATQHFCGWTNWCSRSPDRIEGQQLFWDMGWMAPSWWNEIYLVARITDTAQAGEAFTNQVMVTSSQPDIDLEPYYNNNVDSYEVVIPLPMFEIGKVFESNLVAGTVVTYTLTVANTGKMPGTNLEMIDWTPDWVSYQASDGSYSAGLVTWNIPALAPNGGTASRWFSGVLSCSAGGVVTNQYYRVTGSDQGVTTPDGDPVSFTILAPTILAGFDASALTAKVGETVYFTSTSTTDGTPLTYSWDFGDGHTATGQTASHAFTASGAYTVTLTATDGCGYHAHYSRQINISLLLPIFGISKVFDSNLVAGTVVTYTLTVVNTGEVQDTNLEMIDWTPDWVTYQDSDGSYSAGLVTWNIPTIAPNGGTATGWFSGVLSCSAGGVATNQYYRITDSDSGVTTPDGAPVSFTILAPTIQAGFDASALTAKVGETVYFNSTSTTNGTPLTYGWDFGDGHTAVGQTTNHAFGSPGEYTVTLTATDGCGFTQQASLDIVVPLLRIYLPLSIRHP